MFLLKNLLNKYGVDLYDAGHVHDYAATWPICYNPKTKVGREAKSKERSVWCCVWCSV